MPGPGPSVSKKPRLSNETRLAPRRVMPFWPEYIPGYHALEHWLHGFGDGWLFNSPIHVNHIAGMLLVILFLALLSFTARARLNATKDEILPDATMTSKNFVELLLEGVLFVMQFAMSRAAAMRHFWLIGTLGLFILFSNLMGLIPGFLPPTENFNTTFACAIIVFVYYNFYAFAKLGLGHLSHMANPVGEPWGWWLAWLMFPIEVISHCIRPVSLSIRLLCNMAGDHLVLGVFIGFFPLLLPLPFIGLGLFVSMLQAFIFVLLSAVYIGEVEANLEHHQHAHDDHGGHAEAAAH